MEKYSGSANPVSAALFEARRLHRLTGDEILRGQYFPGSIAQGTCPVDIHSAGGTVLRYLDGREEFVPKTGPTVWRRRKPEGPAPACYQIPCRSLLPLEAENLLVAGGSAL